MIPDLIHTVWLGDKPEPELDPKCVLEHYERFRWNELSTAAYLGLKPHDWEHSTFAGSSNIIRLHAVAKYGGIYFDSDFEIIRPPDELLQYPAWVCRQPDKILCNAAFGAEPNHPWILAMIDNYGDQRVRDAAWGCHIMEGHLTRDVEVLPSDYFYPYGHNEDPKPPTERTIAIHRWDASWVQKL